MFYRPDALPVTQPTVSRFTTTNTITSSTTTATITSGFSFNRSISLEITPD